MEVNKTLLSNLDKIHSRIFKNYLFDMQNSYSAVDFDDYNLFLNKDGKQSKKVVYHSNIQAIKIERWVYDKKEEIIDRFRNIYSAFANWKDSLALIVKRTVEGTEFYFVIKNDAYEDGNRFSTANSINLLMDSIKGNFPGTIMNFNSMLTIDENDKSEKIEEDFFDIDSKKAVSVLTNIASEKSEKHISQGIEKLLNGIVPKNKSDEYTIIFLAEPINHKELLSIRNGYEELASSIYSYAEYQINEGKTSSIAKGENDTESHSDGTNSSLAKTHGFNFGINGGMNSSKSQANGWLKGIIKNAKEIITSSVGANIGLSAGYQYSRTETEGKSYTYTNSHTTNFCVTDGKMNSTTESHKSYPIANLIKRIEKQLERIDKCEAVGLWKEATYILAENELTSKNVANFILGLMQGEDSFVEPAVVNSWHSTQSNSDFDNIQKFVKHFTHPLFVNKADVNIIKTKQDLNSSDYTENSNFYDIECITPTTHISSMELAQIMTFPYKSIQGLSSIECAEFERNILFKKIDNSITKNNREIPFGVINYMHQDENTRVTLDLDSLTKHTFITGSTGSGKSTAIYKMLHELRKKEIPFLVIEPAKGEYRMEFSKCANVYSTNVNMGTLLQINPFKFPVEGILVHEHIDRLVEIFNVCWSMYAAMPAVLKDAIERAYIATGWDLNTSVNSVSDKLFPCFADVLKQLYVVINESDFSQEVKSNYIGSLVTRVRSLTNGIFGQIFSSNDMGDNKLFEDYTIIDLSRIGSMETKAMIMGILVMRMQEYHMTYSNPTNQLRHVTVLEEAHNLLKKTSTEQSSESANLLGKSVEMIANAIAEMRTYGEGFIIADQSPGLMDMSVIRNTNTKIILSLPDFSDRELVGKATGLNDDQIIEVAKLGQGIAIVYQNEWVSPVLCSIEKYIDDSSDEKIKTNKTNLEKLIFDEKTTRANFADTILNDKMELLDSMETEIINFPMPVETKIMLITHRQSKSKFSRQEKIDSVYDLYFTNKIKTAFFEAEVALNLCEEINPDMRNYLYLKWIKALDVPEGLLGNDLMGIVNILLYKLKSTETFEIQNCERLFDELNNRRWL